MRLASPLGSSNCLVRIAQKNAARPMPPRKQRHRDQDGQDFHGYFSLMAFRDTVIDDSDIASAAASGVAGPTSASGTAITL